MGSSFSMLPIPIPAPSPNYTALAILLIRRTRQDKGCSRGYLVERIESSFELRGKTLGIIGYGNIGTQFRFLAEALGMKVIYYDTVTEASLCNASARKTLKEGLGEADIVTSTSPIPIKQNPAPMKTIPKVSKKGSILLNYARGEVVDLDALAKALQDGSNSGAKY